jgi:hypothetical protein
MCEVSGNLHIGLAASCLPAQSSDSIIASNDSPPPESMVDVYTNIPSVQCLLNAVEDMKILDNETEPTSDQDSPSVKTKGARTQQDLIQRAEQIGRSYKAMAGNGENPTEVAAEAYAGDTQGSHNVARPKDVHPSDPDEGASSTAPAAGQPTRMSADIAAGVAGTVSAAVAGAYAAPTVAVVAVQAAGFTSTGIAGFSTAASLMSTAAIANGGGVAAGSSVAVLQAVGATGSLLAAGPVVFAGTAVAGAAAGYGGYRLVGRMRRRSAL